MFSVSIHLVDQAYGGPEEGGWWYQYGSPDEGYSKFTRFFKTRDEAHKYGEKLDSMIAELNKNRPSISSVSSIGRYQWMIQDDLPHEWPKQVPHYE